MIMKALTILLVFLSSLVKAQDIHFSQMYTAPLYLNPANTGFFDGSYRTTAIYRNQWASVTVPYTTFSLSTDWSLRGNQNDIFGIGAVAFSDKAGDSHLTTNMFEGSLSYNKSLDRLKKLYLNFGLQAGWVQTTIDYSNLTFDENFEGYPTTESFSTNSANYLDINYGVEWYYLIDRETNLSLGFSGFHLNAPIQSYMRDYVVVPHKYIINASAAIPVGFVLVAYPKITYYYQYPHQELVFGVIGKIMDNKTYGVHRAVYLGALDRWNDALIVLFKMDINDFSMNLVYDINYSKLAEVSKAQAGPEIAVQYIGKFKHYKPNKIYCPKF